MNISIRKQKTRTRASVLIEVAAGFGAMLVVSLLLLKAAITVTSVQRWTVTQGLSDAYMSREVALGKRLPFEGTNGFLAAGTMFPAFPTVSSSSVTIGVLPGGGGRTVTGTLRRTRLPSSNNLPSAGGTGTTVTNPTGSQAYQLQSYLTYEISGRPYVKSRTILRVR